MLPDKVENYMALERSWKSQGCRKNKAARHQLKLLALWQDEAVKPSHFFYIFLTFEGLILKIAMKFTYFLTQIP